MVNKNQSISILIITYNRCDDCVALLKNLQEQIDIDDYVGEILVLNNNSTDSYRTLEAYLENSPLPIKYINHTENLGVARGRNFLIKQSSFPLLLVLDDDVVFENNLAIKKTSQLFHQKQNEENNVAVITLNIFYYSTKERQKNALPHKQYHLYKDKDWFLTYYFTGAAHLMKKELFEKTGYYPEDFFYGMEEYDLSYRIIDVGYKLAYDNSVKVFHKESPLGRITNKEKMSMLWANKSKVAWRYLPKKYFYTTAIMWSFQYLKKTGYDIKGYFKNWSKIFKIPKTEKRKTINPDAINYLKKAEARLWY